MWQHVENPLFSLLIPFIATTVADWYALHVLSIIINVRVRVLGVVGE